MEVVEEVGSGIVQIRAESAPVRRPIQQSRLVDYRFPGNLGHLGHGWQMSGQEDYSKKAEEINRSHPSIR